MKQTLALASFALAANLISAPASASVQNYALSSNGASFVSASSSGYNEVQQNGLFATAPETTMQNNLLTGTPSIWLNNGETRYIFSQTDGDQFVIVDLGSVRNLQSFGATWGVGDRPASALSVFYAASPGGTWTQIGSTVAAPGSAVITGSVAAQYLKYDFGAASQQYAQFPPFGGSAIGEVFANSAVPEASTWAMMLLGFAGLGLFGYRASRKEAGAF